MAFDPDNHVLGMNCDYIGDHRYFPSSAARSTGPVQYCTVLSTNTWKAHDIPIELNCSVCTN